jgi:hypothetical protein
MKTQHRKKTTNSRWKFFFWSNAKKLLKIKHQMGWSFLMGVFWVESVDGKYTSERGQVGL